MMNLRAENAIRKAESLRMRGRGSGGYYLDGGILWDCEVTCVAQAPDDAEAWDDFRDWDDNPCYDSPWDWENMNSWNDPMYDGSYGSGGVSAAADDASRDIENGQRILSEIENGNVPITATDSALDAVSTLGSAAANQCVITTVNKIGMDLYQVRNLGKAFGILGAGANLVVAFYNLAEGEPTKDEALAFVGAVTGVAGLLIASPLGTVCGGISLGIAIYSVCTQSDNQTSSPTPDGKY